MCGIVGIVGREPVAPLIVDALKRLEYRGYDSAGVATIEGGKLDRRRAEGKLVNLEQTIQKSPLSGTIGIGHTRWATHGVPNETNAHPHFSGDVAVVHNGIIENFVELRDELAADGYAFYSQTDTEVVAHLVARELKNGLEPEKAAFAALKRLKGAFALAIMFRNDDDLIVGARNGPPLAVGHGNGEMYLGSDAIALAPLIWKTATGSCYAAPESASSTWMASLLSGRCSIRRQPPSWSTRAITGISWRRKSTNSRK
jgi:glucosamine--fructose-6-phosphate aminotransferase (isomerizing)